jgi:predicted dehydrogenase
VPVLVEKPLTVTSAEGAHLVRASQEASVPLLVGHHRRHNPLIQQARRLINSGRIGDIRAVHVTCWFYKPDSYFDTAPWRKQQGAGPISVNIVHDVDLMRAFCGDVQSVRAVARPSRRGYENEDVAAAVLEFESGAIGTLTLSDSIAAPWSWEMTARENGVYPAVPESCYLIGGSAGSMSIPDLRVWTHSGETPDWWTPIAATSLPTETSDPLANQIVHFCDVIAGRALPLVSGKEGLKTLQVVEAVQNSAKSGEVEWLS